MASGLLRCADHALPNELALLVIDQLIDDNRTLCALAQTCRSMQHLAEERLYRTIELLSVKDLHAIIAAFRHRHERVRAVQVLKILYQYRPNDLNKSEQPRIDFNECVSHMVNLRQWHIESPYDNFNWGKAGGGDWVDHDMQKFQRALEEACVQGPKEAERIAAERILGKSVERTVGLALLESLTIHSHGASADFWDIDGFHCLFRHPSLRYLHVSCITLPNAEIPELALHVRKTPLTTLVFDECELEPASLLSVLRTPARLKHLTLGENVFNHNHSRRGKRKAILSKHPSASLNTLSAVAHSLETLTHFDPGWRADFNPHILRSVRPTGEGMRAFHSLNYVECDTSSFIHQAVIMNRDLAPPNLETLRVRRHWDVSADFWDQPPDMDHYLALPSLMTLELMQSSFLWHEHAHSEYMCDSERLRNRHAKAYKLSKAGINLKLLIEMHRDPQLIPPYLQSEQIPITECLYDASLVGFHRNISNEESEDTKSQASSSPSNDDSDSDDPEDYGVSRGLHSSAGREPSPTVESNQLAGRSAVTALEDLLSAQNAKEAPETDQLGDADVQRISGETRRALDTLKRRFVRRGHRVSLLDDFSTDDEEFDENDMLEVDDLNEEEDMELELELDDDDDFEDEDGVQIYEHNGELYIEVYESETDEEDALDGMEGAVDNDLD